MASSSSTLEVTVFTDTNLGTHIAMAVSPDTIVGDFKRELERTHFKCLPNLREIKVLYLMVERKSCFYHLPDSFPIKHAFLGHKRSWFVHAEVRPPKVLDGFSLFQFAGKKRNHISDSNNANKALQINTENDDKVSQTKRITRLPVVRHQIQELLKPTPFVDKKRRKKRVNTSGYRRSNLTGTNRDEKTPDPAVEENSGLSASKKTVSVPLGTDTSTSAAIQRQLLTKPKAKSDYNCSSIVDDGLPMLKTPPRIASSPFPSEPSPSTPSIKPQTLEVGKRILAASKNLNSSENKRWPVISSYGFKTWKLPGLNAFPVAKTLVFELSDGSD